MKILITFLLCILSVACSTVPELPTFDRFSKTYNAPKIGPPKQVVSVQRLELNSYREYHDFNEPRELENLVGAVEVYRFWHKPDTMGDSSKVSNSVIRVVRWEDGKWSIAVRSMTHKEFFKHCTDSPSTLDPQKCPRPKLSLNYERLLTETEISQLKKALLNFNAFETTKEAFDEEMCISCDILHGTSWHLEAFRLKNEDDFQPDIEKASFWAYSPPESAYFDLGFLFLKFADLSEGEIPISRSTK